MNPRSAHRKNAPLSGAMVLVVEDEFLIALEAQRIFQDAGAAGVVLANSVAKAQQLLREDAGFNLGILDLRLGDEDASPLVDELRELGIPTLIATGFDSGVDMPGASMIRKPYQDAQVLSAAQLLLGVHA